MFVVFHKEFPLASLILFALGLMRNSPHLPLTSYTTSLTHAVMPLHVSPPLSNEENGKCSEF